MAPDSPTRPAASIRRAHGSSPGPRSSSVIVHSSVACDHPRSQGQSFFTGFLVTLVLRHEHRRSRPSPSEHPLRLSVIVRHAALKSLSVRTAMHAQSVSRRAAAGQHPTWHVDCTPLVFRSQEASSMSTTADTPQGDGHELEISKLTAIVGALMVGTACSATRTQRSAGEVIDDSVLTAKVKTVLIDDPGHEGGQINVETYRGVVQLGGFVDKPRRRTRRRRSRA